MSETPRIAVAGAGSIGCFVGGLLAAAGHSVTLLGRPRVLDEITAHGLTVTDFQGLSHYVAPSDLNLSDQPTSLAGAQIVLVTVKTAASAEMATHIAAHASDAMVVSLQNGLDAAQALHAALPDQDLRAGMVPFNVVPMGHGRYHRATSGDIVIQAGTPDLAGLLGVPGLAVTSRSNIEAVQWGKLLMNLNNALNALSGLTLREQLLDRRWRGLLAAQIAEALAAMKAAGIAPVPPTPLPVGLTPYLLRLPTPLFSLVAKAAMTIDPDARNSMAYDLMAARPTEIDALQGRIIALGAAHGVQTPTCQHVFDAIRSVEIAQKSDATSAVAVLCPEDLIAG